MILASYNTMNRVNRYSRSCRCAIGDRSDGIPDAGCFVPSNLIYTFDRAANRRTLSVSIIIHPLHGWLTVPRCLLRAPTSNWNRQIDNQIQIHRSNVVHILLVINLYCYILNTIGVVNFLLILNIIFSYRRIIYLHSTSSSSFTYVKIWRRKKL